MRRRKAAERDSSGGSDSSKSDKKGKGKSGRSSDGGEETTDLSGAVGVIVKLVRFAIMSVAIAMVTGLFVAGDPLWGYRGKYTKLRTYLPVSVHWWRMSVAARTSIGLTPQGFIGYGTSIGRRSFLFRSWPCTTDGTRRSRST